MRFSISLLFILLSSLVNAQDGQSVEDFFNKLKQEYPQYKLIYMNENLQVKSFVVAENQIVIHDVLFTTGSEDKKCLFYLLDMGQKVVTDTLVLNKVAANIADDQDLHFSKTSNSIFFRPSYGTLAQFDNKRFFRSLSMKIPVSDTRFGELAIMEDKNPGKDISYIHFKNPQNFNRFKDRKSISFSLNGEFTRTYKYKDLPESNVPKPYQYHFNFPYTITSKGIIVVDAMASELVIANSSEEEIRKIELPADFYKTRYGSQLLYDETYKHVYLRLSFEESEKIYWLNNGKFQASDLVLPKTWEKDGSGLTSERHMYINAGKLYLVLNIKEDDKTYDGIFVAYL